MKLINTVVTVITALITACSLQAEPKFTTDNTLVISGPIQQGNIIPVGVAMVEKAKRGEREVQLIINSPGGELITGNLFLALMREAQGQGLKVTCYIPTLAASMAFQILIHCDERHALSNAFLLWHRVRVFVGGMFGQPLTGPQALSLGKSLLHADSDIIRDLLIKLPLEKETAMFHLENETLHTGVGLHSIAPTFITAHNSLGNILSFIMEYQKANQGPEVRTTVNEYEITYIHEQFLDRTEKK